MGGVAVGRTRQGRSKKRLTASEQLSDAPSVIQGLISTYGADRVWSAGINALGYPPSWMVGNIEALAISAQLKKVKNDGTNS